MLVGLHIFFALSSLLIATLSMFFPSKLIFKSTIVLAVGAVVSGFVLGVVHHSDVAQACVSGGIYLSFIISSGFITHRRIITAAAKPQA